MNTLDKFIQETLEQEIHTPENYKRTIKETFAKHKKTTVQLKFYKLISLTCVCMILIAGFVYAKDIKAIIVNFYNNSKGIDTAIQNEYIMNPQVEYIESNNTSLKINNLLMDDFNLNMTFSLKLDNPINVKDIQKVRFPDMIITDENNKIIYCQNEEVFYNYCKQNNLNYKFGEYNENYINNGVNWYIKNKLEETNTVEIIYNLFAEFAEKYPKSKKLFINLGQINMSRQEIYENEEIMMKGNWNIELEIPEQFYNRECFVYNVKNINCENITITEASVYDTCMKFEFTTFTNPIYNENDSENIKNEKKEAGFNWHKNLIFSGKSLTEDEYIEDMNGRKFYPSESNSEEAGTDYEFDGKIKHWQTFNLTKYDMTNNLKIHLILNTIDERKEIIIDLERQ